MNNPTTPQGPAEPEFSFSSLVDFKSDRSWIAGACFYLFYCLAIFLIAGVVGGVTGSILLMMEYDAGEAVADTVGNLLSLALCLLLFALVISARGRWSSRYYLLGLACTFILAFLFNPLAGVAPAAFAVTNERRVILQKLRRRNVKN